MSKLTYEEHVARAMLMGREYDWRDGSYNVSLSGTGGWDTDTMLDCETLDHLPRHVSTRRMDDYATNLMHWDDGGRKQYRMALPWEKS